MTAVTWSVGEEREVSPGNYATLVAILDGWTLWRFENANGVHWSAGKPAVGLRQLQPVGVAQALYGGIPNIYLALHRGRPVSASLEGSHFHGVKAEIRRVGERFTKSISGWFDPLPYDGQQMEVFISSMPGPRSFTKVKQDRGIIDMIGLAAIVDPALRTIKRG